MINELKETHNQNVDQQNGFHHLLDEMGIPYVEDDNYLNIGGKSETDGWVLFLSVDSSEIESLIIKVSPVLNEMQIPFKVVKDSKKGGRKNDFWQGIDEVGKIVTIFSVEEKQTRILIEKIEAVTKGLYGPEVNNAVRIGEITYLAYVFYIQQEGPAGETNVLARFEYPEIRKVPFKIERKYRYWRRKRILKGRYVPLVMLNRSPKGDLLKAVDLKGWKFNWCFIKEGKYHVFNDSNGRYIKDRLLWQKKVLNELVGYVPVPRLIDFFEQGEESYLVMEYLEGVNFQKKIDEVYQERKWEDLHDSDRRLLMGYYLEAIHIIEQMHIRGYVHRDATASNFMVLSSGKMYTIDLELAYCISAREPDPPFTLGSFGYIAPEQLNQEIPTAKVDVYSIGALLLHIITGKHPGSFINRHCEVDKEEIDKYISDSELLGIVMNCLDVDPDKRRGLADIRDVIRELGY